MKKNPVIWIRYCLAVKLIPDLCLKMELVEGEEAVEDWLQEVLKHSLGCLTGVTTSFASVVEYFVADFVKHVV